MNCPLCFSKEHQTITNDQVKDRDYWLCLKCDLIFMDSKNYPTLQMEKDRYTEHDNSAQNPGYLNFLNQLMGPLLSILPKERSKDFEALDYGSGPGPVLGRLLDEKGIHTWNYDLYFADDKTILNKKWDLIVSTEVWEHFREPNSEVLKIKNMLKSEGFLAVMTQFHEGITHFKNWWYVRDFTHLMFYSEKTFKYLAVKYNLEILYISNPIAIFRTK